MSNARDRDIDWNAVLHRILTHPEEAAGYAGHQAPILLLILPCLERRCSLAIIEALVDMDVRMPYHTDRATS